MATATTTVTVAAYPKGISNDQRMQIVHGTVAIQAASATYAAGGLAISWAAEPIKAQLDSSSKPIIAWAEFQSVSGSGYVYIYNTSTNKLQIFTGAAAQSPLTELTDAAAIPAAVSGDTIAFRVEFVRA
jgi:hypothetical protein